MAVRLTWDGKPTAVEPPRLPLRTVERFGTGPHPNALVHGDNLAAMASLRDDYAGRIKLIYVDPPFDTGGDFTVDVADGRKEHAYRDRWGSEAYLTMMYERLVLMHELLADDGSIYVHCGPGVSHHLRLLCDEIFGPQNARNEIVWKRFNFHADARRYGRVTDRILFYTKGDQFTFNELKLPFRKEYVDAKFTHRDHDGRRYRLDNLNPPGGRGPVYEFNGVTRPWRIAEERMRELDGEGRIHKASRVAQLKRYLDELDGQAVHELWTDIAPINPRAAERLGYPTQKPEALVERILRVSSDPGDLVADFFAGAGTLPAVAERLDRSWIACDAGRIAVQTARKRLLGTPGCGPFELVRVGEEAAGAGPRPQLEVRCEGGRASVVLKGCELPDADGPWTDLVDSWAVDFDHRDGVFQSHWWWCRPRTPPGLVTQSESHPCGRAIAVKVVDVFGNESTTSVA